ncbi:MAG: MBL fold metallo-hydrolase [Xanthomonadales bacterium]|nr:MBL fold metallo-hydrolase [Xanthomonadales bacterium]
MMSSYANRGFWLWVILCWSTLTSANPVLEVQHLGNEGVLLHSGETTVLIDAFIPEETYGRYAGLAPETWQSMLDRRGAFSSVRLALASHVHVDHFQPDAAVAFLRAHPETEFVSTAQVVEALASVEGAAAVAGRVEAVETGGIDFSISAHAGIRVEFLRLDHGGEFEDIQNLGHLVHVNGFKVLHIGDAEMSRENFQRFGLAQRDLDVAFVPYWYFLNPSGVEVYRQFLQADSVWAVHIPPAQVDQVRARLAESFPEVLVGNGNRRGLIK